MRAGDRNAALWDAIERLADHGELCATLNELARAAELTKDQTRSGLGALVANDLLTPIGKRGQITIYQITDPAKSHGPGNDGGSPIPLKGYGDPTNQNPTVRAPESHIMEAAENRIRNSLMHMDREPEVIEDLFGKWGLLQPFAGDERLRNRMLALWRGARHTGERLERELDQRCEKYRGQRLRREAEPHRGAPEPMPMAELIELARDPAPIGAEPPHRNGNGHREIYDLPHDLLGWEPE